MFLAHICDNAKQSLKDHCYNSAEIAQNSLREIGLDNTSYLAALFHDCGKANDAFQQYLIDSFNGKPVKKGSVIHSFAGENYFLNQYHNTENVFARITSEILAYSIGSHHGLFDICDPDMQNGFKKRLAKQPNDDKKSADNFLNEVIDSKKLSAMFSSSVKEIEASLNKIAAISNNKAEDYLFYLGLLNGRDGQWKVRPVEYKHGSSKINDCDRLQATAQAMCLEEMFNCEVKEAHIFYNETRQREKFEILPEFRNKVANIASEMHNYYSRGYTPKVKPSKACRSCSLSDLCLPNLLKAKNKSVKNYMSAYYRENEK